MSAAIRTFGVLMIILLIAFASAKVVGITTSAILLWTLQYAGGAALWIVLLLTGIFLASDGDELASEVKSFLHVYRERRLVKRAVVTKQQDQLLVQAHAEVDALLRDH